MPVGQTKETNDQPDAGRVPYPVLRAEVLRGQVVVNYSCCSVAVFIGSPVLVYAPIDVILAEPSGHGLDVEALLLPPERAEEAVVGLLHSLPGELLEGITAEQLVFVTVDRANITHVFSPCDATRAEGRSGSLILLNRRGGMSP